MKWNEYTWYSKWASLLFFIIVLPILTFYIGRQYESTKSSLENTQITTQANIVMKKDASKEAVALYIGSITPSPAFKGSIIEIRGSGFNGFEGDVYFTFKRSDGKSVRLAGLLATQVNGDAAGAQIARVTLKEPCQEGQTVYGEYSGIAAKCDYVELTPGTYIVTTSPWGLKSNEISLIIAVN